MSASMMPTYARAPIAFDKGEGCYLIDEHGERYLDCGAGVAVNVVGHSHPHLVEALINQAQKVWHTSNIYRIPEGEKLATRLTQNTFADQVFFTNSGAEALECSIKVARKYHHFHGHPEKYKIITMEGAFHGRTLATLAAGGQAKYLEGFGPVSPGFTQFPFGDIKALKSLIDDETAAILIEPIQGEGGVRVLDPQVLKEIRHIATEHNILLVLDEVQCGIGRTGYFLAHELADIKPDIVALAKGLGGGFPIGACLATHDAAVGMVAGSHGSTFGGNPLATAVGNAVLDIVLDQKFLDQVKQKSLLLKQKLASLVDTYPAIFEQIRGEGLMLGLKLKIEPKDFVTAARNEHLLTVGAGDNVVRIIPPLTISEKEIEEACQKLERAAQKLNKQV